MVATRSGLRVCSPTKTNIEQPSNVQATPSNGRRTRSAARQADISTRRALVETSERLREETSDPQTSVLKKCTRTSRLHSPEQPCAPVGSTHEADVSNLESGCSVTADVELPVTRSRAAHKVYQEEEVSEVESCSSKNGRSTRRRAPDKKGESGSSVVSDSEPPVMSSRRSRRLAVTLNFAEEEVSEADSCSSLVSAQKTVKRTRSKAVPDVDPVKAADDKEATCDLVLTESQSVTRSQRKSTRIYANPQPDESDVSDAESFTLDVSGAADLQSSSRRSMRSRKLCPIPFNLDEASESPPTQSSRRTTTTNEKSCDSEGFESGTEYTICTRQTMKTRSSSSKYAELDSDLTDGHSAPGSPCRSRAGSGSGRQWRPAPNSTLLMKDLSIVLENATEGNLLHDSMLDSTVVAEEADCTLLEEEKKTTLMSNEAVVKEVRQGELDGEEVSGKVAVASADQQGELSAENQEEDASAVEKIEDTGPSTSRITCDYVRTDDETNENVHMEVSLEDQGLHGDVSGTQEEVEDMEVQQVTPEDVKAAQETMMESSKEEEGEDIDERKPGEVPASVDEQVTPEKTLPEDTKTTRDTPTVSHMEISEEVEKKEDKSEEEDIGERPDPSRKPEEKVTSSVNEQMTLKKSSSKEIKATPKTKTIRLTESSKEEEGEDIDERKPGEATASVDEQVTPEKSLPEDTKTTRDMPTVSHMEISEEVEKKEDESEEEDLGERPGPSRKPEEKVTSSVNEQMTLKKSSSQEIKATPKTKTIRLTESSKEEEGEDIDERKPGEATASVDEQVTPEKSLPEDTKTTRDMPTVSHMEISEEVEKKEDESEEEDLGERPGPSRKPEEKVTSSVNEQMTLKKSSSQEIKATPKTKTIRLTESSKEEEGEDIDERKPGEATASVDEQVTPEKSLPEDTKTTRDMPTVSHMEISEEVEKKEDESEEEDLGERPGPSRKPEEKVASSVNEQMTLKKSSSKEIKATPKTKTIRLMESSEDEEEEEDVSDQEDDDMGERRGSSMKHEKEVVAAESIDGLFMVDTRPGQELDEDYYTQRLTQEEVVGAKKVEEEEEEFVDEEAGADDDDDCGEAALLLSSRNPLLKEMSSRIDPGINMRQLGGLYITFDGSKSKPGSSSVHRPKEMDQDEVMKKSVLSPDFEKKDAVPPYSESKHALKRKRRVEREKTTGDAWFNMKAPELSNELKGDLKLLKMRASMDPKRFYKKNDRDGFAKYFQMATVVDNPVDFYHSRIPKKQRKRTMVEELLADAEFRSNNKKKFQKIVAEKAAQASGKHKKYKKNKFHKKSEKVTK
ncbi:deoxynucleotidyltransferase terminal-interacting protein 2 [Phycodurus eques]|uniref:deoxynucleotidyltransferase terminal-interacting protein 2 n=1 Tax=Phycodurus eques TaxID=693459 RepID=UPI002ACE72E5|nr:deoxynucleotidyltransferase terminal-interacting protein 2 [Phycodurus eques]